MEKSCTNCGKPVGPHGARGYCPTCYMRWKRNGAPVLQTPEADGACLNCGAVVGYHGAKGYCPLCYQKWRKYGDPTVSKYGRLGLTCSECDETPVAKGFCPTHYQRWKKHGDPNIVLTAAEKDCSHCGDPVGRHGAYGYCGRCYQRWRRHGDLGVTLPCDGRVSRRGGSRRLYSLNDDYFTEITTPEQAYWLGFITADGCVLEDSAGRPSYLRVDLAECDDDHLRALCIHLGSDRPVLYSQGCACVSFGSRRLANALCKLGVIPRKSLIVEPWAGPAELMSHYWRGLFDGDGTIFTSKSSWCTGICGTYACVAAFGSWAREITGSRAQPRIARKGTDCWHWTCQGSEKSQMLATALYRDSTVALERKRVLADELLAIDFAERRTQRNAKRAAAMRDAWASGRHSRAMKT